MLHQKKDTQKRTTWRRKVRQETDLPGHPTRLPIDQMIFPNLSWVCWIFVCPFHPLNDRHYVSVVDKSKMLARHIGNILLCRPFFKPTVLLQNDIFPNTLSCMLVGISTSEKEYPSKQRAPGTPPTSSAHLGLFSGNKKNPAMCHKPFNPKPGIQHSWRGRGMPTLTWEEVIIREGKRRCFSCTKMEIMSLEFYLKVIYYLHVRSHVYYNASNTRKCNFWCQKESYHVLDHFVCDSYWMTIRWPLDRSIFTSYPYELVLLHWFLSNNIFHDSISYSWMKYWISESAGTDGESVNLYPVTRLASDLGWTRQKYHRTVHMYICMVHF